MPAVPKTRRRETAPPFFPASGAEEPDDAPCSAGSSDGISRSAGSRSVVPSSGEVGLLVTLSS